MSLHHQDDSKNVYVLGSLTKLNLHFPTGILGCLVFSKVVFRILGIQNPSQNPKISLRKSQENFREMVDFWIGKIS